MQKNKITLLAALLGSLSFSQHGQAVELGGIEFTGSGFMTLAVGHVLGGTKDSGATSGYKGPHFISDWAQGGVYEDDGLQFSPDSKIGLQGTAAFNSSFSVTGQVVSRGARDGKVNLEWLYGTYKINDHWTVQLGRKRLPIFSLSETQDVGLAYPWVHLPPDTYGWQVVNYNGANLMYSGQVGDWSVGANLFYGRETNKDTGYWKMYYGKDSKTNARWTDIIGVEGTASNDWFEARIGYFENNVENGIPDTSSYLPKYKQKIHTLGLAADRNNIIGRAEFYYGDVSAGGYKDYALSLALGYRIGKFTPMLTYSKYFLDYLPSSGLGNADEERHDTRAISVRYDLSTSSAIKVQFDSYRDLSGTTFRTTTSNVAAGNVRLLTVSYDMVF